MTAMMPAATVPAVPVPPAAWPCHGVCQVTTWSSNSWACPASSPAVDGASWMCTREEGHIGAHVACVVHSTDPGHHQLHEWEA